MTATYALSLVLTAAEAHIATMEAAANNAARRYDGARSSALMDAASDLRRAVKFLKPADFPMEGES